MSTLSLYNSSYLDYSMSFNGKITFPSFDDLELTFIFPLRSISLAAGLLHATKVTCDQIR